MPTEGGYATVDGYGGRKSAMLSYIPCAKRGIGMDKRQSRRRRHNCNNCAFNCNFKCKTEEGKQGCNDNDCRR